MHVVDSDARINTFVLLEETQVEERFRAVSKANIVHRTNIYQNIYNKYKAFSFNHAGTS